MSREVRRVPLDFEWPLDKVWHGYLMPDSLDRNLCPDCAQGWTYAGEWLNTLAYRIGMLAADIGDQQRGRHAHPWLTGDPNPPLDPGRGYAPIRPSADIADLIAGLTGETPERVIDPVFSGHRHRIVRKIIEAAGLDPNTWGICTTCNGRGAIDAYPGQSADIDAWQPTEPPTGDGWQLWETTSEGSPIGPVLPTAEDLAQWMASPENTDGPVPLDTARAFITARWAPSGAIGPDGRPMTGIEFIAETQQ